MKFYYNSLDKKCKSIMGAIRQGETLTLNIYSDQQGDCRLDLNEDGGPAEQYPMEKTDYGWTIRLKINQIGLYFYRFVLNGKYIGRDNFRNADFYSDSAYQLTVYAESFSTPKWFKGGVMYQIFPDRFAKEGEIAIGKGKILRSDWGATPYFRPNEKGIIQNNDFFGGNINGIISKLDYLQSLHVTAIYLNPIFESSSNHRYDTGDYKKIDSLLGTEEDFKLLIKEAEKRGIRVILDGVFNHTGDDSIYFNRYGHYKSLGAYQSVQSPYYDWYNFYDYPNGYDSWWGIKTLPAINEHSASYQNFIFGKDGVIKHWLAAGIGGYRLDVADELPDFFLEKLRTAVKEDNPEALIIGEVWEDASNKISYGRRRKYFWGNALDSVMNYPLKNAIIHYVLWGDSSMLSQTMGMLSDNYPKLVLDNLMNILSTHDTARILTVLSGQTAKNKEEMAVKFLNEEEKLYAIEKVKMAALLQYTLPGVPCVYYGDENAMEGYTDPFCRRCFDWNNLNQDLISFYRKLGEIRAELKEVMSDGVYVEILRKDNLFMFARVNEKGTCFIFVNNGNKKFNISFRKGNVKNLLTGETCDKNMEITPYSYGIFSKIK